MVDPIRRKLLKTGAAAAAMPAASPVLAQQAGTKTADASSGPLEVDRPWDSYADDHLGLMDHLGIDNFMVLGFCIAAPFIWNLIKRAPNRVVAAVPAQPVGFRPELPNMCRPRSDRIAFQLAGGER